MESVFFWIIFFQSCFLVLFRSVFVRICVGSWIGRVSCGRSSMWDSPKHPKSTLISCSVHKRLLGLSPLRMTSMSKSEPCQKSPLETDPAKPIANTSSRFLSFSTSRSRTSRYGEGRFRMFKELRRNEDTHQASNSAVFLDIICGIYQMLRMNLTVTPSL